jgi:RNA polymerase sigma factor (sigma-70 family)
MHNRPLRALTQPSTAGDQRYTDSRPSRCSVASLVAAAARGDQRAWDVLFKQFDAMLRRVTRGFRLTSHQADDVVQETWMRLVRHLHRLENPSAVGAWLATTARRESLRMLQRTVHEVTTDELIGIDEPDPDADADPDALGAEGPREIVRSALDALPPRERALLEMLHGEPAPSYEHVAGELGIPVGSIGPTRARALARLRRHPRLAALRASRAL